MHFSHPAEHIHLHEVTKEAENVLVFVFFCCAIQNKILERKYSRTQPYLRNVCMRVGWSALRCQMPHGRIWHIVAIFHEISVQEIKHGLSVALLLTLKTHHVVRYAVQEEYLPSPWENFYYSTSTINVPGLVFSICQYGIVLGILI